MPGARQTHWRGQGVGDGVAHSSSHVQYGKVYLATFVQMEDTELGEDVDLEQEEDTGESSETAQFAVKLLRSSANDAERVSTRTLILVMERVSLKDSILRNPGLARHVSFYAAGIHGRGRHQLGPRSRQCGESYTLRVVFLRYHVSNRKRR